MKKMQNPKATSTKSALKKLQKKGSAAPKIGAKSQAEALVKWYLENRRPLPWRKSKDPYRIWISEVMLQQTQVQTVIPYFEKFILSFPTVHALAAAPESKVLSQWAGLGYYSRARNLHAAARQIAKTGFAKTYEELLSLPGFGPYTARAVASIAFDQKVGVLDGNVIRVLSRNYGLQLEWWKTDARNYLQELADQLAAADSPSAINQGLMELGATICTPQKPACLLCPWQSQCVSFKTGQVLTLPLARPRKKREIWLWEPQINTKKDQIGLIENNYMPFLKNHWIIPGSAKPLKQKPARFDFKHSITHHDIFVRVKPTAKSSGRLKWVALKKLSEVAPSSLIRKAASLATLGLLVTLIGCSSPNKSPAAKSSAQTSALAAVFEKGAATATGRNRQSVFADANRLFFLSQRSGHSNFQVYELILDSHLERRWTFQIGEVRDPAVAPQGRSLAFASSNDEGKNVRALARSLMHKYEVDAKLPDELEIDPFEIYTLSLEKHTLTRITKFRGADVFPNWNDNEIIWLRYTNNKETRFMKTRPGSGVETVLFSSPFMERELNVLNGQAVWTRTLADGKKEIYWSKLKGFDSKKLQLPEGEFQHPRWLNDREIMLSGKPAGQKYFDIYTWDINTGLLNPLHQDATDKFYPTQSPLGTLSYTSSSENIFIRNLVK